jgi:hypothetical protein
MTLAEIRASIRRGYKVPALCAAVLFVVCCLYIWIATPMYEASIAITARAKQDTTTLGGAASSLGLGLLGRFAPAGTMTDYEKLTAIIMTGDGAERLMKNDALMAALFPDTWDAKTRSWRRPHGAVAAVRNTINAIFGLPEWKQPGVEPVLSLLNARLRLIANDTARSHTLLMRDPNPQVAADTLSFLLKSADDVLKERERKTNSENIAYLRDKIDHETIVDVRTALSRRLSDEFVNEAILAGSAPYSYDILKGLNVSSRPVVPRPVQWLTISVAAGIVLGCLFLVLFGRPDRRGLPGAEPDLQT